MTDIKQIFVGGFGGAGTRLIQLILQGAGFYVGDLSDLQNPIPNGGYSTESLDFCPLSFIPLFDQLYFDKNEVPLREMLKGKLNGHLRWSIKHGHLMLCIPFLKEWFPGSKFILVVRNPLDNLVDKKTIFAGRIQKSFSSSDMSERLRFYEDVTHRALGHVDLVVRLEDLCFSPREGIGRLLSFAGMGNISSPYEHLIHMPMSIGKGREYYGKLSSPIFSELGYQSLNCSGG